jgi:pseudaminic acid cytidylyltransferase
MRVAIIPARSGSQRIPDKNIKDFLGIPIIGRVITNLIESGLFDRIIVSTNSNEIANLSRRYGGEVPFMRPEQLSDNFTDTKSVIRHAIETLGIDGSNVDYCCVYPTSVLITREDLVLSHHIYSQGSWDFVFTAFKMEPSPLRGFKVSDNTGGVQMLYPEYWDFRSQDLPATYLDAGLLYWGSTTSWASTLPIFGPKSTFLEIPSVRAVDINYLTDWERAEMFYASKNKNSADKDGYTYD